MVDRQILVEVTQADIDRGCQRDAGECPIALALARVFGDSLWVCVDGENCFWEMKNGVEYQAKLPPTAVQFINRFDFHGREGKPLFFSLEEPEILPKLKCKCPQGFTGLLIAECLPVKL